MDAENLVINESLDQIKAPPTGDDRTKKRATRPADRAVLASVEEQHDSRDREEPHRQMEVAVLDVLPLEMLDGLRLAMLRHADQMMPLKNLVQNDAIGEAPKPQPKDKTGAKKRIDLHCAMPPKSSERPLLGVTICCESSR